MPSASPRHANNPNLVALGDAIRRTRLAGGISQEDLAHRSGLDRSYMSSIERGMQNPGIVLVMQIAQALGVTGAELLGVAGI